MGSLRPKLCTINCRLTRFILISNESYCNTFFFSCRLTEIWGNFSPASLEQLCRAGVPKIGFALRNEEEVQGVVQFILSPPREGKAARELNNSYYHKLIPAPCAQQHNGPQFHHNQRFWAFFSLEYIIIIFSCIVDT